MSNDEQYIQEMMLNGPGSRPENYEFFAICVGNEVAQIMPAIKTAEGFCAAMGSNPTIIKLTDSEKNVVLPGMTVLNTNIDGETPRFGFVE